MAVFADSKILAMDSRVLTAIAILVVGVLLFPSIM